MKKKCKKCGNDFLADGEKQLCPDCAQNMGSRPSNLGQEDLVSHFDQDIGLRLQRVEWGHFDDRPAANAHEELKKVWREEHE